MHTNACMDSTHTDTDVAVAAAVATAASRAQTSTTAVFSVIQAHFLGYFLKKVWQLFSINLRSIKVG